MRAMKRMAFTTRLAILARLCYSRQSVTALQSVWLQHRTMSAWPSGNHMKLCTLHPECVLQALHRHGMTGRAHCRVVCPSCPSRVFVSSPGAK